MLAVDGEIPGYAREGFAGAPEHCRRVVVIGSSALLFVGSWRMAVRGRAVEGFVVGRFIADDLDRGISKLTCR